MRGYRSAHKFITGIFVLVIVLTLAGYLAIGAGVITILKNPEETARGLGSVIREFIQAAGL
jgi:hypothetical protein